MPRVKSGVPEQKRDSDLQASHGSQPDEDGLHFSWGAPHRRPYCRKARVDPDSGLGETRRRSGGVTRSWSEGSATFNDYVLPARFCRFTTNAARKNASAKKLAIQNARIKNCTTEMDQPVQIISVS